MQEIPTDLKYTSSHEWARLEEDGTIVIGITDYAQNLLGDLVYVELPTIGITVQAGDECAVVESVKAASDVYSPVSGEIIEVNDTLVDAPGAVNNDPYGEGWLFRLKPNNEKELNKLLDAAHYQESISTDED